MRLLLLWPALCLAADRGAGQLAKHIEENVSPGDVRAALAAFDTFSEQYRLGMHLGAEKGALIESAVHQGLPAAGPGSVLETGCHAGDGTLRAMSALSSREGSTIVSTENNGKWLSAAKRVVGHATKGLNINFVPVRLKEDAAFDAFLEALEVRRGITEFSTVIFDQNPTRFLEHLKALLVRRFVRRGATLYVDNAKTKAPVLEQYLDFVSFESGNGFNTTLIDVNEPYADTVAVSTFFGLNQEL
mmetsp:Transcript_29008/g.67494  ORF Transcript_29008/g.67494 Transcript_29008/m.67494 type:complete len:245 (+) Transcript_29008:131-865(+)